MYCITDNWEIWLDLRHTLDTWSTIPDKPGWQAFLNSIAWYWRHSMFVDIYDLYIWYILSCCFEAWFFLIIDTCRYDTGLLHDRFPYCCLTQIKDSSLLCNYIHIDIKTILTYTCCFLTVICRYPWLKGYIMLGTLFIACYRRTFYVYSATTRTIEILINRSMGCKVNNADVLQFEPIGTNFSEFESKF